MLEIFTIGYSGYNIDAFIATLIEYKISFLIDVRSQPFSKYFTDYNEKELRLILNKNHIIYRNFKEEFGARQLDKIYYNSEGVLDYKMFTSSKLFEDGYKKVLTGIEMGYSVCLMCAEKDPINCHRSMMIGRELYNRGFEVKHVMPPKKLLTQKDLEERLLEIYFPHRDQYVLGEVMKEDKELIEEAYFKKNIAIGFRQEEEE